MIYYIFSRLLAFSLRKLIYMVTSELMGGSNVHLGFISGVWVDNNSTVLKY